MICEKCGHEIAEDKKFCGYCGHVNASLIKQEEKTEDLPVTPGIPSSPDIAVHEEPVTKEPVTKEAAAKERVIQGKQKKKHTGIFVFVLSFFLVAGIISGMWGAHYVAKNGWESVPFAEKLTFLPFVKFDEEEMEIYTEAQDEQEPDDLDSEKESN